MRGSDKYLVCAKTTEGEMFTALTTSYKITDAVVVAEKMVDLHESIGYIYSIEIIDVNCEVD